MPDDNVKRKLLILARSIKARDVTLLEEIRISNRFDTEQGTTRQRVVKALSEGLNIKQASVQEALASDDDSDRIVDELDDLLGR